jgi:hypothetical protein
MELVNKLRIDVTKPVWVVNAPGDAGEILPGAELKTKLGREKPASQLLLFAC